MRSSDFAIDLPTEPSSVALSADGKTLLFYESGEGGGERYSIYVRPTDGGLPVRLGEGRAMSLSPDGKRIAFSYQGDIWTVPAGGGTAAWTWAADRVGAVTVLAAAATPATTA